MTGPQVPAVDVPGIPADALLLDCRNDEEWAAGHIDGALHLEMNTIPQRLHDDPALLDPGLPIVVVCRVGNRAVHVTHWLNQNGYDAATLAGGMVAWDAAGRPMTSETGGEPFIA